MTKEQEAEHLDVHVAVCAERYKSLQQRLDRIKRVMWWMTDTIASSVWVVPSNMADTIANQAIHLDDGVTVSYDEFSPMPVFSQGGVSFTSIAATIYLSGGSLANQYIIENRITTAGGRKYARRIQITIQNAA